MRIRELFEEVEAALLQCDAGGSYGSKREPLWQWASGTRGSFWKRLAFHLNRKTYREWDRAEGGFGPGLVREFWPLLNDAAVYEAAYDLLEDAESREVFCWRLKVRLAMPFVLLGEITPQAGSIRRGVNLQVCYFDQLREQLREDKSARWNVADGNDFLDIGGRQKHVMTHLKDFLFTPDRATVPVSVLSGGERNRLLLARLFTKASNVLVMDEPTNDLDVETLDLLEELLLDYPGTLLLVSHDRAFLNNVVTSTIAFEGHGRVREYVGGYDDWLRQRPAHTDSTKRDKAKPATESKSKPARKKLSYKEKFELEKKRDQLAALPARIETLESELDALQAKMTAQDYFKHSSDEMANDQKSFETLEKNLENAYGVWEELEAALEGVELD